MAQYALIVTYMLLCPRLSEASYGRKCSVDVYNASYFFHNCICSETLFPHRPYRLLVCVVNDLSLFKWGGWILDLKATKVKAAAIKKVGNGQRSHVVLFCDIIVDTRFDGGCTFIVPLRTQIAHAGSMVFDLKENSRRHLLLPALQNKY